MSCRLVPMIMLDEIVRIGKTTYIGGLILTILQKPRASVEHLPVVGSPSLISAMTTESPDIASDDARRLRTGPGATHSTH